MAATFKNLATKVTNMIIVDGDVFYTFDNGESACRTKEKTCGGDWVFTTKCLNVRGRGLANTGRFSEIVEAQHKAIHRFNKEPK